MDDNTYELLKSLNIQKELEEFDELLKGPHKYVRKIGSGKNTKYIYTTARKPIILTKKEKENALALKAKIDISRNEAKIKEKINMSFEAKNIKKGKAQLDIKRDLFNKIADATSDYSQMEIIIDKISRDKSIFNFDEFLSSDEIKNVKDYAIGGKQSEDLIDSLKRWKPQLGTRSSGYGEALILFAVGGAQSANKGDVSVNGKYYEMKANGGKLIGDSKFNKHAHAKPAETNFSKELEKLGQKPFVFNPEHKSPIKGIQQLNKLNLSKDEKKDLLINYAKDLRPGIDLDEIKNTLNRTMADEINRNTFFKGMAVLDFKKYKEVDDIDGVIMISQWTGTILNISSAEKLEKLINDNVLEAKMEIRPNSSGGSAVQLDFKGAWGKKK